MLNDYQRLLPIPVSMISAICLAIVLIFTYLSLPATASAHSTLSSTGPTLQANVGFNTRFRDGNWIPVQISLSNNGPDFEGTIAITTPSPFSGQGNGSTGPSYQESINLPNGTQKQITIDIPINLGGQGASQDIHVNLLDTNGHVVSTQTSKITSLAPNDVFIGILSDLNSGFSPLYSVALPNQGGSVIVESLTASTLPPRASVLKNFDLIVLDNFTTSNLNADQLTALQSWVNQGGALIEAGGPEWRRTLSSLPSSLLPVMITGTATLPKGSQILPVESRALTGQSSSNATVPISVGTVAQNSTTGSPNTVILSNGNTPLIVQSQKGQGFVSYLAFDPALDPIATWTGANTLWRELVIRGAGDKLIGAANFTPSSSALQTSGLGGLLQGLLTNNLPSPWLLLALLLGYLIILGPVRFLIIRWRKRRDWSWRIVLASIAIFSLLAYGLAVQQKGTTVLSNSVSIMQLNAGGSSAHISTFVSVFVPNQGNYQVHLPDNGLVQPTSDQYDPNNPSGTDTTIAPSQSSTDVNLQGVKIWTLRSLVSDRDHQMSGSLDSHLNFQNYTLTGTITNTLGYDLSDVYILMANSYIGLGKLAAGQTLQISVNMHTFNPNNGNTSLADELAQSNNLPTGYGNYVSNGNPPQNELQRHLAILSALSGTGSYISNCGAGPCSISRPLGFSGVGKVFVSGPGGPISSGPDPLLLPGSPATLIGWANQTKSTALTINGTTPNGLQETLIQAPLAFHLSGTLNLPPSFLTGQIVDVQGTSLQSQYNGTYTLATGSVTFEFALPNSQTLNINSLTVTGVGNLTQNYGPPIQNGSGNIVDASHFHSYLYNWQTNTWDPFKMSGLSISTTNIAAYISPAGRVLAQFANQDSSIGTIYFAKPSLTIQGTASP